MMKMNEFVRAVRLKKKLTQEQFAELFSVTKANISAWEVGRHEPSLSDVIKMHELVDGKIPMPFNENIFQVKDSSIKIPILQINEVAVMFAESGGFNVSDDHDKYTTTSANTGAASFAVVLNDSSMSPMFEPRDEVVIDTKATPRAGDFVLAKLGQSVFFRKFQDRGVSESGNQLFDLMPLNQDFQQIKHNPDMQIIGVAVEHRRSLRRG
jgi:SOS-response transcriptional repressor LexA